MSKVLGIDWGEKRCGIALADPVLKIALAREVVGSRDLIKKIKEYIKDEEVRVVVLGNPVRRAEAEVVKKQIKDLAEKITKLGVKVKLQDESLSTLAVDKILREMGISQKKARTKKDAIAAQIILQSYLDRI